ncbi:hypothetical protein [uncultured Ferrovibrio sp.]|jgi:hypothetical protein|uniref:hypothetical protein n=1 Tax=uncultured Ferrovibrio sp. TaxID=1576913 RepID=UPI002608B251|nr:hypothetical protein [uncultured Ferrovibrio sp.]
MRSILNAALLPLLLAGLLSACASERDNLTPAAEAVVLGLGVEVIKTKIERRLEITCNPLNLISDGTYCVSNYKPTDRQEVWCFKTLAGVDCYGEPDPYSLQGRALPAAPRPLADPRMPMEPPGRHPNPEQVAVAPIDGTASAVEVVPAGQPPLVAPTGAPRERDPVIIAPVGRPLPPQATPDSVIVVPPSDINERLAR